MNDPIKAPWGSHTILAEGLGWKVKLLRIEPGESLSLQRHAGRSEFWIVTKGNPLFQVGHRAAFMEQHMVELIAPGEWHRIVNPVVTTDQEAAEVLEVQFGEDLSEDDIERIEDKYGRVNPLDDGGSARAFDDGRITVSCTCGCGGKAGQCSCEKCRETGWLAAK